METDATRSRPIPTFRKKDAGGLTLIERRAEIDKAARVASREVKLSGVVMTRGGSSLRGVAFGRVKKP